MKQSRDLKKKAGLNNFLLRLDYYTFLLKYLFIFIYKETKRGRYKMRANRRRSHYQRGCIFPGYKWCGPGCSGPGFPVNDVDACCKAHDICLRFHPRCYCDHRFLNCLRPKVNFSNEKGRVAGLMHAYMRLQTMFTCN